MARSRRGRLLVILLGSAALVAVLWLVFAQSIRRFLVKRFDTTYSAPSATPTPSERAERAVALAVVARGLRQPTDIQFVPGRPGDAIVLEKTGTARLLAVRDGAVAEASKAAVVFERKVLSTSELGLLGLAFHPRYEENGLFYVNYNPDDGGEMRTKISEWRLPPGALGREPAEEARVLLEVEQPYQNHDGGQLAFGPDSMLYIGLGDGGWMDDPHDNAQKLSTLLGKMLRIDVDRKTDGLPYGIPADNPFVGTEGARAEIWAYGLRNPWRYSFDPAGRLVVADVGQNLWEEVSIVRRGANLGWKVRESSHCFEPKEGCRTDGLVDPVFEYGHELGQSITGGYVVTSDRVKRVAGRYVVADFTSGRMWALTLPDTEGAPTSPELLGRWSRLFSTFGRDAAGEVYVADYAAGEILRIDPER